MVRACGRAQVHPCTCCSSTCRCRRWTASSVISALSQQRRPEPLPEVVFVTAHDEYALRAFDAHAIDYLLKPFSDERFQAALDRGISHVRARTCRRRSCREMQALLRARVGDGGAGAGRPRQRRRRDARSTRSS